MIATSQITMTDLNDPIQQGTEPNPKVVGMQWLNTSVTPNKLARWSGTSWVDVSNINPGNYYTQTEINTKISQTNEAIALKADKTVTDGQGNRMSNAETSLTLKADQATLNSTRDGLQTQINAVPGQITAAVTNLQVGRVSAAAVTITPENGLTIDQNLNGSAIATQFKANARQFGLYRKSDGQPIAEGGIASDGTGYFAANRLQDLSQANRFWAKVITTDDPQGVGLGGGLEFWTGSGKAGQIMGGRSMLQAGSNRYYYSTLRISPRAEAGVSSRQDLDADSVNMIQAPQDVYNGGTGGRTPAVARANLSTPSLSHVNGYWGLGFQDGSAADWMRTTQNGIIPYASGGASNLGTETWPFNYLYARHTFGGDWYGNAIPVARGGTGQTSVAGAQSALGIARGNVTMTNAGARTVSLNVSFGRTYSSTPTVVITSGVEGWVTSTKAVNHSIGITKGSITTTGFQVYWISAIATSRTADITWIAVGS